MPLLSAVVCCFHNLEKTLGNLFQEQIEACRLFTSCFSWTLPLLLGRSFQFRGNDYITIPGKGTRWQDMKTERSVREHMVLQAPLKDNPWPPGTSEFRWFGNRLSFSATQFTLTVMTALGNGKWLDSHYIPQSGLFLWLFILLSGEHLPLLHRRASGASKRFAITLPLSGLPPPSCVHTNPSYSWGSGIS